MLENLRLVSQIVRFSLERILNGGVLNHRDHHTDLNYRDHYKTNLLYVQTTLFTSPRDIQWSLSY